MGTAVDSVEVIILSDDEPDEKDASVLFVEAEDVKKNDSMLSASALDEDLVVTFSRRADLLPHARYDCTVYPFTVTECEISTPVDNNQLICEQCFCYICDKLASECAEWCRSGVCHCNSHKKSTFWNNLRNSSLLGGLQNFNLTLCEIDSQLRDAETMLQNFRRELSAKFSAYLNGMPAEQYGIKLQGLVHDYSPVYVCVSSFLNLADKQDSKARAIMQLGAAEDFIQHFPVSSAFTLQMPVSNAAVARTSLLNRVISSLQRQMVMDEFTPEFSHKLQEFYKRFSFPIQLKSLKNSLCVRPWSDILLVSVLKGQNVSGVRKDKGRKDVLIEQISVVLLRTERLQRQQRYRELCRYLRVVQTDDPKIFHQVLDLMPFFLCLDGELSSALQSLLSSHSSRLTPHLFLLYLRIFETAMAPIQVIGPHSDLHFPSAVWKPIKEAVPLRRLDLVKFALKVQTYSSAVFNDSPCWIGVLTLVSSPGGYYSGLPEPSPDYLHESKDLVRSILLSQSSSNFHIPRNFQEVYPDQALLLLLTEALAQRILKGPLSPVLPVLRSFQKNMWALRWLWENLSSTDRLSSFIQEVTQEMDMTDRSLGFLQTVMASSQHSDQQSRAKVESIHPK